VTADTDPAAAAGRRLAAPFPPGLLGWLPLAKEPHRDGTMPVAAYLDGKAVTDRLDEGLGVAGWEDAYDPLPTGCVRCRLRCKIAGEWVAKEDVGGPSAQPDPGDKTKAAFTDALKRAAVKFGVGRYLAALPRFRVRWDDRLKRPAEAPELPAWALPAPPAAPDARASGELARALVRQLDQAADAGAVRVVRLAVERATAGGLLLPADLAAVVAAGRRAAERTKGGGR
jgi:hypothetical protein